MPGLWSVRLWGRKVLEVQIYKENKDGRRGIGIDLGMSFRQDHAGFYFYIYLWQVVLAIQIYDGRHWCSEHGCWFDEKKHPYHEE
jgi:hypothetical protein